MGHEHHAGVERQQQKSTTGSRGPTPVQRAESPGQASAAVMAAVATPGNILALQRTIGNAAVNQLLRQRAAVSAVSPAQRAVMPAAFFPGLQRHAESEEGAGHICTASCQHAAQRATEGSLAVAAPAAAAREGHVAHVCGPHCHHTVGHRAGQASVMRATVHDTGKPLSIQRHSSFEHKMLGDVSPDDLKVLASAANLDKHGNAVEKDSNGVKQAIVDSKGNAIGKKNVIHVLEQEIRRLNYFKSAAVQPDGTPMTRQEYQEDLRMRDNRARYAELAAPIRKDKTLGAKAKKTQLEQAAKDVVDTEWQVRIVSLPSRDGSPPLLVTYGEMNTLADLYGSPREIYQADPKNRYQIVQGIRQQAIMKFLDLLREVKGVNYLTKKFGMHLGEGFDDAIGSTGRGNGPLPMGELRLMGKIPLAKGKKTGDADASQSYTGGLARNACHFAPESWHAWADYHDKARLMATGAYDLRNPAGWGNQPSQADLKKADDYENLALVFNGFGDHFLQDSYAAGHLINKTQIMQYFVKWLDAHPFQSDKEKASEWRRIQPMAYNQPGLGVEAGRYDATKVGTIKAKDPQSVENMDDPNGDAVQGRKDRFAALGLTIPPSLTPTDPAFNFLVEWQYAAARNSKNRTMTVAKAITPPIVLAPDAQTAAKTFNLLVMDDVARVEGKGIKRQDLSPSNKTLPQMMALSFVLRNEYVPKNALAFATLRADLGSINPATKATAEEQYGNKALNVTYAQYHKFLNSTLLQASTNVLHDHFCKNGIEVQTASGVSLGRIYGDDAMLGKDSAKGVQYSGETARMSRQAIFDLIDYGPNNAYHHIPAITDISERFPTKAKLDDGSYGSLDRWHTDLEKLCNDTIFPDLKGKVTGSIKNIAATVSSEVSPKVSKDVHPGADVF